MGIITIVKKKQVNVITPFRVTSNKVRISNNNIRISQEEYSSSQIE